MANGLSSLTTQFWVSSEVTAKAETDHFERTKTAVKIELINRLIFIVIITPFSFYQMRVFLSSAIKPTFVSSINTPFLILGKKE